MTPARIDPLRYPGCSSAHTRIGSEEVHALRGVDLELYSGEIQRSHAFLSATFHQIAGHRGDRTAYLRRAYRCAYLKAATSREIAGAIRATSRKGHGAVHCARADLITT